MEDINFKDNSFTTWSHKLSPYSVEYHCDNDCTQGGCPGHVATLQLNSVSDTYSIDWGCSGAGLCLQNIDMVILVDFVERLTGKKLVNVESEKQKSLEEGKAYYKNDFEIGFDKGWESAYENAKIHLKDVSDCATDARQKLGYRTKALKEVNSQSDLISELEKGNEGGKV